MAKKKKEEAVETPVETPIEETTEAVENDKEVIEDATVDAEPVSEADVNTDAAAGSDVQDSGTDSTEEVSSVAAGEPEVIEVTEPDNDLTEESVEKEPVEEVPDEELIDADIDLSDLPDNYGDGADETPDADVSNPEAPESTSFTDPLPEKDGDFYLDIMIGYGKREVVEGRLRKYDIGFIVTATGNILVGPYTSIEDATEGRKRMLSRGFKGTVVKVED